MSDMETARKAGGNRPLFTGAVLVLILGVFAVFIGRLLLG